MAEGKRWAPAGCSASSSLLLGTHRYHCLRILLLLAKREWTAQPGEKKVQWGLTNVHKYLKGGCKEERGGLSPFTGTQ